jgi:hypothetical protein
MEERRWQTRLPSFSLFCWRWEDGDDGRDEDEVGEKLIKKLKRISLRNDSIMQLSYNIKATTS